MVFKIGTLLEMFLL